MAIRNAEYLKMRLTTNRSKEDFIDLIDTIFALESSIPTKTESKTMVSVAPCAGLDEYISTDYFGVYIHGTKNGLNDLPISGCYHGDAWMISNQVYMWSATSENWVNLGVMVGVQGPEGPEGPEGVQGVEGPEGPEGIEGLPGIEGPQGPKGDKGSQGPAGLGLHIMGSIKTVDELYSKCISRVGQTWFLEGVAWMWDGENFVEIGKINGPEGPEGPSGQQGSRGERGDRGEEGKAGEAGAQGPRGAQGLIGAQGDKGDIGDSVDLVVRTVTTVESSEEANVVISEVEGEKDPKQYVDFFIPRGKKGKVGPIGPPNYLEVGEVGTLPYGEKPQIVISSQSTKGIKLNDNGSVFILAVDNYGKLFTELMSEENFVAGYSHDFVEIFCNDQAKSVIVSIENGRLVRQIETEIPDPEPEVERVSVKKGKIFRNSTPNDPILLVGPNLVTWKLGLDPEHEQIFTEYWESGNLDSIDYVNQKITMFIPEGRKGDKGNIGSQGPANEIVVGKVEGLLHGEKPEVTITKIKNILVPNDKFMNTFNLLGLDSVVYKIYLDPNDNLSAIPNTEEFPTIKSGIIENDTADKFLISINSGVLTSEPIGPGEEFESEILMVSKNDIDYFILDINENNQLCFNKYTIDIVDDTTTSVVSQEISFKIPAGPIGLTGKRGLATKIIVEETITGGENEPAEVTITDVEQIDEDVQIQRATFKLPLGPRGPKGYDIDHKWEDTYLFIKGEDETEWGEGVNLKGETGDSTIFEGGIISGNTVVTDCMAFKTQAAFGHELFYNLISDSGKKSVGYSTIIAKNTLQIGYDRGDDEIEWEGYNNTGEPFNTDPQKYLTTPSEIIMKTIGGISKIEHLVSGSININNDIEIAINTPILKHNGIQIANKNELNYLFLYMENKFENLVNDELIRAYIYEEDIKYYNQSTDYTNSSISTLNTYLTNKIQSSDASVRIHIKNQDQITLSSAKKYTDDAILNANPSGPILEEINELKKYVDSQDQGLIQQFDLKIYNLEAEEVPYIKTYIDENDLLAIETSYNSMTLYVEEAIKHMDTSEAIKQYVNDRDLYYYSLSRDFSIDILDQLRVYLVAEDIRHKSEIIQFLSSEDAIIRLELQEAVDHLYEYIEQKIGEMDIIGSVSEYIDQKILECYNSSLVAAKEYTDITQSENNIAVYKKIDEEKYILNEKINSEIFNLDQKVREYINNEVSGLISLFDGKLISMNDKIDRTKIEILSIVSDNVESTILAFEDVYVAIENNKEYSTNYTNFVAEKIHEYIDSKLSDLDVLEFTNEVHKKFFSIESRIQIDEDNLKDLSNFTLDTFTQISDVIEALNDKIESSFNLVDENGILWKLGVDNNGAIRTMKQATYNKKYAQSYAKRDDKVFDRLMKYIETLQERILKLEEKRSDL